MADDFMEVSRLSRSSFPDSKIISHRSLYSASLGLSIHATSLDMASPASFGTKKIAPPCTKRGEKWQAQKLEDQLRTQLELAGIEGRGVLAKVPGAEIVAESTVLIAAS